MAASGQGWFRKRSQPRTAGLRVLTAAATRIDLQDRQEARMQRALRQGWQGDAWSYRDAIGELRYAIQFLANCTARMRVYPAIYPQDGESDSPIPLHELSGVPEGIISDSAQAMIGLGHGKLAIAGLLHSLSTNTSVAGESFLLGMQDPTTGEETWSIRSVDEIVVRDDRYQMREVPSDPQGVIPWITLDPELTVVSRIWTPHPRFRLLADSPLRAMLDDCESLMILRRMIRATGRSRLAGRGILFIPEEISIKTPNDDNDDPEADDFLGKFTTAMVEPIEDEGVASAVVPIVLRGPGDRGAQIQHIDFASHFDDQSSKTREELIGIIATSFDLPKEIIAGVADLNHWSAWQVDDNTFRHHVEPHVIGCCDSLTAAYLRPYLTAAGQPEEWVNRVVMWYDPTELVTHPDQTADAMQLHDRLVISDEALLKISGFGTDQAPSKAEIQVRLLEKMRMWPPNLVMAFLHQWDPTIQAPPITVAGTIPGIKPTGVDTGTLPGEPGAPAPATPAAIGPGSPAPADTTPGPPAPDRPMPAPPAVTAAGSPEPNRRLSGKLARIDQDLRGRLQTAANAAMLRQLERAGARMRTKVAKDETLRTRIAHRPNERVTAILGEDVVTAAGLTALELLGGDWSGLRSQFYEWTEAAQKQAIKTAMRLAKLDATTAAVTEAEDAMRQGRDTAWTLLSDTLTGLSHHLLYNPDPNQGPGDWADLNPDTLVPAGTIRAALAVAGGATIDTIGGALSQPVGQVGTGATIGDLITSGGGEQQGYEWTHASTALHPFEPHLDLDGVEFDNFDDPQLENTTGWPDNAYYLPGDHDGCLCDAVPQWVGAE